ncbi:carbonyl reductase [NADPH] 3-like isoform X2 [Acanthaster planci]|uniref:carbonyl reductase (NADPH) n=1 Tax=Acanthaster planci TaxID=133434 RepID=A0A8B7XJC0_ACAPL|nr:carbonyl reductase [NADPH] 3-like isoform X2 [Acanthaster planci]
MAERVVVVTGANKGIGFAIVRALCKQLDNGIVYLTARNEERGREAVAKLSQEGLQPKYHQLDVTDRASVSKLRDFLKETHGGLDILVNNAAVAFKMEATDPFGIQATVTLATNFTALLEVSRALLPLVRPHGRIVNVASMSGPYAFKKMSQEVKGRFQAVRTEQDVEQLMKEFVDCANAGDHMSKGWPNSAYGTSKMGVIALTRVQAADIAKDKTKEDVLITCCCPGYVDTDMTSHKGSLTIDEGAVTPVYLALLPTGSSDYNGKMFSEKAVTNFW